MHCKISEKQGPALSLMGANYLHLLPEAGLRSDMLLPIAVRGSLLLLLLPQQVLVPLLLQFIRPPPRVAEAVTVQLRRARVIACSLAALTWHARVIAETAGGRCPAHAGVGAAAGVDVLPCCAGQAAQRESVWPPPGPRQLVAGLPRRGAIARSGRVLSLGP